MVPVDEMSATYRLHHSPNGSPVARFVHVYLRPLTDERKLRLARERFSKKNFDSSEVVPGAIWEVATNVWCAYEPDKCSHLGEPFHFYEPMPPPVYARCGVLLQED